LHEVHLGKPFPLQKKHFKPSLLPVPLQKEQTKGPVPEPLQAEHSLAIALPVKAKTPADVANHLIALRRLIRVMTSTPIR
jgi:hypothetical protein